MPINDTSAHRAAGEALAPGKEAAGVRGRPESECESNRLLNFKASTRRAVIFLGVLDVAVWVIFGAIVGGWLAEVLR